MIKEPIEYLGHVNCFTTREELYNIGRQMQIDAYNEAINDAAKNAEHTGGGWYRDQKYEPHTPIGVDKKSILKLLKK